MGTKLGPGSDTVNGGSTDADADMDNDNDALASSSSPFRRSAVDDAMHSPTGKDLGIVETRRDSFNSKGVDSEKAAATATEHSARDGRYAYTCASESSTSSNQANQRAQSPPQRSPRSAANTSSSSSASSSSRSSSCGPASQCAFESSRV